MTSAAVFFAKVVVSILALLILTIPLSIPQSLLLLREAYVQQVAKQQNAALKAAEQARADAAEIARLKKALEGKTPEAPAAGSK